MIYCFSESSDKNVTPIYYGRCGLTNGISNASIPREQNGKCKILRAAIKNHKVGVRRYCLQESKPRNKGRQENK